MKWRNSFIYLLVFLLVGGYYYYFEVVKKEQKEAAERESKRLVRFQPESVGDLEIHAKGKEKLHLKKDDQWRITEPIRAEVDASSLQDYLTTLSKVDFEKEITSAAEDLKAYGLQDPPLRIRWQAGELWQDLLLGDKNPAGDAYYARTGDRTGVYLISAGIWSVLNKNLNELRKRELFSFLPKDARVFEVLWREGGSVRVEAGEDGDGWKVSDYPQLKIKKSKVENILEQLSWLRAREFLENEAVNLKKYGLDPPHVIVKVTLKDGKSMELRLSGEKREEKTLKAMSSQLPAVVQIDGDVLKDLPVEVATLEDRTLFSVEREKIRQVKCRLGDEEIQVVQKGENQWNYKKGNAKEGILKEAWPVRSLLWNLADAEYDRKLDTGLPAPAVPHGRLEVFYNESKLVTLSWAKRSEKDTGPVNLWMEQDGKSQTVQVSGEVLSKIEEDLSHLMLPEDQKKNP